MIVKKTKFKFRCGNNERKKQYDNEELKRRFAEETEKDKKQENKYKQK